MRNRLAGKPKIPGQGVIRAGKGTIRPSEGKTRAGQHFNAALSLN